MYFLNALCTSKAFSVAEDNQESTCLQNLNQQSCGKVIESVALTELNP
jgi:hypothetical protein